MDKVKKWCEMTRFEKTATIIVFTILIALILVWVLWLCGVLENGVEISQLLTGTAWLLIGLTWWKKNRKLAIVNFVLSGLSFALALARLLFLT